MKKTYLLALFFILTVCANSQQLEWGDINKSTTKRYYPEIIGEDHTGIYIFSQVKNDLKIEKYSRNNKTPLFERIIDQPKINGNKVILEQVSFSNGNFIILASYFHKEKNTYELYGYIINGTTGESNAKVDLLSIPVENKRRKGNYSVFQSEDNSKILINHYAYYREEKAYHDNYILLDDQLNILLNKVEKTYKEDIDYKTYNYIIDNDGSIYFLKSFSLEEKYIVTYDATKEYEKWEQKVVVEGMKKGELITDLRFTIDKKNNLVASGYYENKNKLIGCFFMKIDNFSKEILTTKVNIFDKTFNDQFKTNHQVKKSKDAKINNIFDRIEIVQKEDGGIILIGEFYYHVEYYSQNGGYIGQRVTNGDLIVINLSDMGDLIWAHRIPKNQYYYENVALYPIVFGSCGVSLFVYPFKTMEYFSYMAGLDKNNLCIIFNDNPANLKKSENERTKAYKDIKKGVVMLYKIDKNTGEKSKEIYRDIKSTDINIKPAISYQKEPGSDLIIFAQRKKDYRFGEFKFE